MKDQAAARFGACACVCACLASFAGAQCREVAAPQVIRESGCYRLVSDITAPGPAAPGLAVYADEVTIDLGGHHVRSPSNSTTGVGVHVIGAREVAIRNGSIDGFLFGIKVEPFGERIVRRAVVQGLTVEGASARGIYIKATDATVEDNIVRHLNGYSGWPGSHTIGIEASVTYCRIVRNKVAEIYPEGVGEAIGVSLTDAVLTCTVERNDLTNSRQPRYGRAIAFWVAPGNSPPGVSISRNVVSGFGYAFMVPPHAERVFQDNRFSVDCTPRDILTYGAAAGLNSFNATRPCGDLPSALEKLARDGDSNWTIRLAQAYLEEPWKNHYDSDIVDSCRNYARARSLLAPLAKAENAIAVAHLARLDSLTKEACNAR